MAKNIYYHQKKKTPINDRLLSDRKLAARLVSVIQRTVTEVFKYENAAVMYDVVDGTFTAMHVGQIINCFPYGIFIYIVESE